MRERRQLDVGTTNWLLLITLATYLAGSAVGARLIDNFALQILVVQMCVLAPTIVFCLFLQPKGERLATIRDDLCIRPVKISTVLLVAVTMLFLSPLLTFVNLLSQLLSNYVAAESIVEEISGSPFWVAFAVIAVLPRLLEVCFSPEKKYGEQKALPASLIFESADVCLCDGRCVRPHR